MSQILLFAFGFGVFLVSMMGTVAALVTLANQPDDAGSGADGRGHAEATVPPVVRTLHVVSGEEAA